MEKNLSQAFDDKERLENENKALAQEISDLRRQKNELEKNANRAREIYQLLQSAGSEEERIKQILKYSMGTMLLM